MHRQHGRHANAAILGICGISIPCGFAHNGSEETSELPVGLQIMGPAFGEEAMLRVAYAYEQATEWHKRRPALITEARN